ncbi:hypothetical protein [Acidipila sp. EB88]|uniref:hypothetical protein n=1 Tax=Acidipila sp. EB88 TaxID=2305226 RepID=UPI000F5E12D0|nr:hypothetical protein [Acidipila sp. EB88]
MQLRFNVMAAALSLLSSQYINAQVSTGCEALLAQGVYDGIQQTAANSSASSYHSALCTGTVQQSSGGGSAGGGASIVIPGLNIPLGLNFNDAQNFQNSYKSSFCHGLDTHDLSDQNLTFLSSVASPVLVQGYNACVASRRQGIQSSILTAPDNKSISFEVWFTPTIHPNDSAITGKISINPASNATCDNGVPQNTRLGLSHQTMVCTRVGNEGVTIILPTSQGDLRASLPPAPPPPSATQVIMGALPKGIILPWSDASVSIPNGWHICDGTNNTPDLRDRVFLQGSAIPDVGKIDGKDDGWSFGITGMTGKAGNSNSDGWRIDNKGRGGSPGRDWHRSHASGDWSDRGRDYQP